MTEPFRARPSGRGIWWIVIAIVIVIGVGAGLGFLGSNWTTSNCIEDCRKAFSMDKCSGPTDTNCHAAMRVELAKCEGRCRSWW